jgi:hypothetical protein
MRNRSRHRLCMTLSWSGVFEKPANGAGTTQEKYLMKLRSRLAPNLVDQLRDSPVLG